MPVHSKQRDQGFEPSGAAPTRDSSRKTTKFLSELLDIINQLLYQHELPPQLVLERLRRARALAVAARALAVSIGDRALDVLLTAIDATLEGAAEAFGWRISLSDHRRAILNSSFARCLGPHVPGFNRIGSVTNAAIGAIVWLSEVWPRLGGVLPPQGLALLLDKVSSHGRVWGCLDVHLIIALHNVDVFLGRAHADQSADYARFLLAARGLVLRALRVFRNRRA